jgi:hypothetical protein
MALTIETALGEMLRKRVAEFQQELAIELINARDLEPMYHRGRYQGLAEALTLLDDCEKKLAEH